MKPSTAKAKGAKTESLWMEWHQRFGDYKAERRHLKGALDQGDTGGIPDVCEEIKSAAKLSLPKWMRELAAEVENSKAAIGALVMRPKGRPDPSDWWIMMTPEHYAKVMHEAGYFERKEDK